MSANRWRKRAFPTNGVHGLESLILLKLRFRFFAISSGVERSGHGGRAAGMHCAVPCKPDYKFKAANFGGFTLSQKAKSPSPSHAWNFCKLGTTTTDGGTTEENNFDEISLHIKLHSREKADRGPSCPTCTRAVGHVIYLNSHGWAVRPTGPLAHWSIGRASVRGFCSIPLTGPGLRRAICIMQQRFLWK